MSKKGLAFGLKLLLSGLLIGYLFRNIDVGAALERARALDPWLAAATLGLFVVQASIAGWRWNIVLKAVGEPLSFGRSLVLCYIGSFFNQALPSAVGGDAVRMYKGYKGGLSLSGAINSVMLDRLSTVVSLVFLVVVLQPFLMAHVEDHSAQWVFPLLSVGAVIGLAVLMLLDRMPASLRRWQVVRGLAALAADTRRLFLRPSHAALSLFSSTIGHLNLSFATWVLARGLGIEVGLMDCLVLIPPVILVTTLPISIGGWGVREGAMVGAFALVGVPAESSLVLSILFGLTAMISSLPGGALWLLEGDRKRGLSEEEMERAGQPLPADGGN